MAAQQEQAVEPLQVLHQVPHQEQVQQAQDTHHMVQHQVQAQVQLELDTVNTVLINHQATQAVDLVSAQHKVAVASQAGKQEQVLMAQPQEVDMDKLEVLHMEHHSVAVEQAV